MNEKILNTQEIFKGRVVHLCLHDVELPDGKTAKRELVHHSGAVAIIALDEADNVLLVQQFRIGAGKVLNEIPAGLLEPDEDLQDCAIRELQEETGYKPQHIEAMGGVYLAPGYSTEYIHYFLARSLVYAPLPGDSDEFIQLNRVPLQTALTMIDSGEIVDAKSITALLRVARQLGL